jgi:hypothetical protein
MEHWETWQARWWSSLNDAVAIPAHGPLPQNRWKRLPKGAKLISGPGFALTADDDPVNANRSDLEIVTDPFDETPAGHVALTAAMNDIVNWVNTLSAQYVPSLNNHEHPSANLIAGAIGAGATVDNPKAFFRTMQPGILRAKVQTTAGLRLEAIARLIEDLYPTAGEGAVIAGRRAAGRLRLVGWNGVAVPGPLMQAMAAAPGAARQAIHDYQNGTLVVAAHPGAPPTTGALTSLLTLVVAYLSIADQGLVRSYPKTIAPLMARTDFSSLYALLNPTERQYYQATSGQEWLALVLVAMGWNPGDLDQPVFAQGIQTPSAGVPAQLPGLTRRRWLVGMTNGTDYLTRKKFPTKGQRHLIEGLGSYGSKMDKATLLNLPAPIFEIRSAPMLQLNDWVQFADDVFHYAYFLNRGADKTYGER